MDEAIIMVTRQELKAELPTVIRNHMLERIKHGNLFDYEEIGGELFDHFMKLPKTEDPDD